MKNILGTLVILFSVQSHSVELDTKCLEAFQAMGQKQSCRQWLESTRGEYTIDDLAKKVREGVCSRRAFRNLHKTCSNVN